MTPHQINLLGTVKKDHLQYNIMSVVTVNASCFAFVSVLSSQLIFMREK